MSVLLTPEQEEAKRTALIADIEEGITSLDAGEGQTVTAQQILAEIRSRRAAATVV